MNAEWCRPWCNDPMARGGWEPSCRVTCIPGRIRQLIVVVSCLREGVHNFITSHSHLSHNEQRCLASALLVRPRCNTPTFFGRILNDPCTTFTASTSTAKSAPAQCARRSRNPNALRLKSAVLRPCGSRSGRMEKAASRYALFVMNMARGSPSP